jgi:hypothetical protein
MLCAFSFHVHDIYFMKILNCISVIYVRIKATIEYDHEKLKQVKYGYEKKKIIIIDFFIL